MRVICIIFLMFICNVWSSEFPDFPFISVQGKATQEVAPDTATINVDLSVFDKTSEGSMKQLKIASQKILGTLDEFEIDKDAIEATKVNKREVRERGPNNTMLAVLGYEMSRNFSIELDKIDDYSAIAGRLLKIDGLSNVNTHFDVSNRDEIEAELTAQAGENARLEAKRMTKGLGVDVGAVYAIRQGRQYSSFGASHEYSAILSKRRGGDSAMILFAPKTISIDRQLNVIFRLAQ